MTEFQEYIKELQSTGIDQITEHSKRGALENLLKAVADRNITILHEPKREAKFGAPDFKITNASGIIGYIENKKIDENLDKIVKSAQIKKYKELSDNILLTNYIEWIWLKNGEINGREQICFLSDLENPKLSESSKLSESWKRVKQLIEYFLSQPPIGIATANELAQALAIRSRNLRDFLSDELEKQEKAEVTGVLRGLYQTFQTNIFNELKVKEFADAFAQMLVYGLFLAKLNADTKKIDLYSAKNFIPQSYSLIKELVHFLEVLEEENYNQIKWIIEEVLSVMNNLDLFELQKDLSYSKTGKQKEFERDPYIYFYEDFLSAYDSSLRKAKGVYYTPEPVVNFIIRSINEILIKEFKISEGLADRNKVTVLDFAAGTGTFLLEILRQILDNLPADSSKKELLIKEHILKNLYGFEYLIAPYTIAHLKLSQFLKNHNYTIQKNERPQLFLTNTLQPVNDVPPSMFAPALTQEGIDAQKIKDKPILVITGNPPYSISSANKGKSIMKLLDDYKRGIKEKSFNALSDDYIKFIRFAHKKMENVHNGVVAIITNNSFLDGIVHRKMRELLLKDFNKIYILNLHGSSIKKEKNQNVFDIRVGVCISFFIKSKAKLKDEGIYYHSINYNDLTKRENIYRYLHQFSINSIQWKKLAPQKEYFWFTDKNLENEKQYKSFYSVSDIFRVFNSGIKTARDSLVIDFKKQDLANRLTEIIDGDEAEIRHKYNIKDTNGWTLERFKRTQYSIDKLKIINYRIFDKRWTIFDEFALQRSRFSVMKHFLRTDDNIGLVFAKQVVTPTWQHAFACDTIVESSYLSNKTKEWSYVAPLYLIEEEFGVFSDQQAKDLDMQKNESHYQTIKKQYEKAEATFNEIKQKFDGKLKSNPINIQTEYYSTENLTPKFRKYLDNLYQKHYSPEQILGYIYAILHSPAYRTKYAELLKIDFPKIPFTTDKELFVKLSEIGKQLYKAHTMDYETLSEIKTNTNYKKLGNYAGLGDNVVIKPNYQEGNKKGESGKLYINKIQYFDNVPSEVWDFYIGGYKVLDKYLKDHKKTTMNLDKIENVENIIKVLLFSIDNMKKINELTNMWI